MVNIIYKEHDRSSDYIISETEVTIVSCTMKSDLYSNCPYLLTYVLGDNNEPQYPLYIVPENDYDKYESICNGLLMPIYDVTIKVNNEPTDFRIKTLSDMYEFKDKLEFELILSDL